MMVIIISCAVIKNCLWGEFLRQNILLLSREQLSNIIIMLSSDHLNIVQIIGKSGQRIKEIQDHNTSCHHHHHLMMYCHHHDYQIIGKSGQRIKEIRENSGAGVKVFSTCAPQSSDRCVQVILIVMAMTMTMILMQSQVNGVLEKVVSALQEIFEVVANTEVSIVISIRF